MMIDTVTVRIKLGGRKVMVMFGEKGKGEYDQRSGDRGGAEEGAYVCT